jgi:hypothetical protein
MFQDTFLKITPITLIDVELVLVLRGTQGNGVPQLIFRNFNVPLLLLRYNRNA